MFYGRASLDKRILHTHTYTHMPLFPMRFSTVSSAHFFYSLHSLLVSLVFLLPCRLELMKLKPKMMVTYREKSENTFVTAAVIFFCLFVCLVQFYFSYLILFCFKCKVTTSSFIWYFGFSCLSV